jgi:hypothetical protein
MGIGVILQLEVFFEGIAIAILMEELRKTARPVLYRNVAA